MSLKAIHALAQADDDGDQIANQPRRPRVYTIPELLVLLHMPRRTFSRLRASGSLPFLEELRPRLGRCVRYRAELVDRYLAGQWGGPRAFRRSA